MKTESTEVDVVLAACARVYSAQRINVETLDAVDLRENPPPGARLQALVARRENRIECVIPRDADLSDYPASLDGIARAGWDVWVLVPTENLGSAHRHLRGVDVTLQPWWESGSDILFGRPEIP